MKRSSLSLLTLTWLRQVPVARCRPFRRDASVSPASRLFITISACALLSQGHHDFSLRSSSKSVIILHSRLHLCTTPGIELYECSSWGRGADFSLSSCGCPAGSALFAGESIFGLLPRRVPFLGSAASVCGGLLTGSPPCSARPLAALGRRAPLPCWGFDPQ